MAIAHTILPIYGFQFHPESIGTDVGKTLLKNFLKLIKNKSKLSQNTWQKFNFQNSNISYFMNLKIKELQLKLKNRCSETININAKIYNRQKNTFSAFKFDLVHLDYFNLN